MKKMCTLQAKAESRKNHAPSTGAADHPAPRHCPFITTKLSKIEKNKLDMNDVSINDDLSDETKEAMAHYKTIALFGLDNRSNGSLSKGNSDVIMLANIDTKQHTINLVSVYRDSYLDTGNGTYQKCNAAYARADRNRHCPC